MCGKVVRRELGSRVLRMMCLQEGDMAAPQIQETEDEFPSRQEGTGQAGLSQRRSSLKRQNSWAHKDAVSLAGSVQSYAWGNNDLGQLGLGGSQSSSSPQLIEALKGREVVLVSGNLFNTAFLLGKKPLLLLYCFLQKLLQGPKSLYGASQ